MAAAAVEPLSLGSVVSVLFGLGVVLALLLTTAWLVRRLQQVRPAQQHVIQVVAQLPLGLKERLLLVRVGDQQVLIGSSSGQLRTLHAWSSSVSADAPAAESARARPSDPAAALTPSEASPVAGSADFLAQLRRLMTERKPS